VTEVHNELQVAAGSREASRQQAGDDRDFGDFVDNATLKARVKYALIANDSTEGFAIDVDTMNRKVPLTGEVESDQQKQLAERIAGNVDGDGSSRKPDFAAAGAVFRTGCFRSDLDHQLALVAAVEQHQQGLGEGLEALDDVFM